MKLQITHMKAPWPAGAQVGDVVELDVAEVPGWAVGKCTPAAEDAEVFAPATGEARITVAGDTLVVNPAQTDAGTAALLAGANQLAEAAEGPAQDAAAPASATAATPARKKATPAA